jgi:hypothetical protein
MKSTTPEKKKTMKLKIDDGINFKIIGISSHENDYRLVWAVNNQLNTRFIRIDNLSLFDQKLNDTMEFSKYGYTDEDKCLKFNLISNRCPNGFLFPQVKNFDYLFQIFGEISETEVRDMLRKLKSVAVVSAAFELSPEKLKSAGRILME